MEKSSRPTIGYLLGAALLFALFLGAFALWEHRSTPHETPEILVLGDSIFASEQGETSVANLLAGKLGMSVTDCSFGGTTASYLDVDARLGYTADSYCLAALVRALTSGDFRVQRNARPNGNVTDYFDQRIAVLEQVDLSGVKILVLDHCVNDYQGGAPILDEANPASEYTYRGALRYALKTLRKNYPELRIVLVSAPNVAYWDKGAFATEVDYGCGTLDEYVETQKAVAEEYGVEWIDLFHELVSYGGAELTVDGVHPNETGREQIAEIIAEKLR